MGFLEHLPDDPQLQLGAPVADLVLSPAATAPNVTPEEAALLKEGDHRKTEDATHRYNWHFSKGQGRFIAPVKRWKIKKNERERAKWARLHPPPVAQAIPVPNPIPRDIDPIAAALLLEAERDVTEDEFYRYYWRWNTRRRMFLPSLMRDPELKTLEEQAQWRATH